MFVVHTHVHAHAHVHTCMCVYVYEVSDLRLLCKTVCNGDSNFFPPSKGALVAAGAGSLLNIHAHVIIV